MRMRMTLLFLSFAGVCCDVNLVLYLKGGPFYSMSCSLNWTSDESSRLTMMTVHLVAAMTTKGSTMKTTPPTAGE